MAQVARTYPTSSPAAMSSDRQPAGMRNIASIDTGPVDGLYPSFGVAYDENAFSFSDYSGLSARRRGPVYSPISRIVVGPSQAVISLFEFNQTGERGSLQGVRSGTAFVNEFLPRAISLYEANVRFEGEAEPAAPGESLSVRI